MWRRTQNKSIGNNYVSQENRRNKRNRKTKENNENLKEKQKEMEKVMGSLSNHWEINHN